MLDESSTYSKCKNCFVSNNAFDAKQKAKYSPGFVVAEMSSSESEKYFSHVNDFVSERLKVYANGAPFVKMNVNTSLSGINCVEYDAQNKSFENSTLTGTTVGLVLSDDGQYALDRFVLSSGGKHFDLDFSKEFDESLTKAISSFRASAIDVGMSWVPQQKESGYEFGD